jgi:hypothetical protein
MEGTVFAWAVGQRLGQGRSAQIGALIFRKSGNVGAVLLFEFIRHSANQ